MELSQRLVVFGTNFSHRIEQTLEGVIHANAWNMVLYETEVGCFLSLFLSYNI